MKKTSIGFAMTGSFCTFERVLRQMEALVRRGYEVLPVLSFNAGMLDTRFMTAEHLRARIVEITGNEPIDTLAGAEPIGPKKMTDVFLIAPATGNSLAKLAAGIYDTPALLGAKSHLRNDRPHGAGRFHQRRAGRGGAEHRPPAQRAKYLFRALWAGRPG